jgi:very-short-patch-repair endonuclease
MSLRAAEQPPDDSRLAKLAERQHGVASRRQLLWLGFSSQAIKTLVKRGRLHRLSPGVYAVGHTRLTAKGRWMAAVLACGPAAVLSHGEAAALHDLRQVPSGPVNVTAASRHDLEGIRFHWARTLDVADTTTVDGIPVTTLARTYLDLAEVLNGRRLIEALEAGQRLNKLDLGAITAVIARHPGRHGIHPLQRAIHELADDPPLIQSPLEHAFRDIIGRHHLPPPQFNVYVEGELVDAVWPDHRLVVEVDGWSFHRGKRSFAADRRRDRKLIRAGWTVVRFTYADVTDDPAGVAAELSELLRDGPWPPPAR